MDLRSGRRLGSRPQPGPRRLRRPPGISDGGGSDRISALPDEMLVHILVRLRCARAAAHTSGLSRRWRGLWRQLPELSFRDISADALDAALGQVTCTSLSLLEVDMPEKHRVMDPARVAALLRAAARLAPADLVFGLWGHYKDRDIPIEIPSFERATTVKLKFENLYLTAAGGAKFPQLERLSISRASRCDTEELVLRCPRLRVFEISGSHDTLTVKVHSSTIEELIVEGHLQLRNVEIIAPVLKKFRLYAAFAGVTVALSAPMLENLRWHCSCMSISVGFGGKWLLRDLFLEKNGNVDVLCMSISSYFQTMRPFTYWSFSQEIERLPAFSVLELHLLTGKHVFGALVSHLLGICSTIKSLKMDIQRIGANRTCKPNCSCDQPQNWRNGIISLTALEDVVVRGFGGTGQEVDLLKLIFRCAPLMKRIIVVWAPESAPTLRDYKEIDSIFEASPDVKCYVYLGHPGH